MHEAIRELIKLLAEVAIERYGGEMLDDTAVGDNVSTNKKPGATSGLKTVTKYRKPTNEKDTIETS